MEESKGKTPGKKLLNSLYKNKMGNNPQVLDIYIRDIYNEIISKVIENVKPIKGITSNVISFENHLPKNENDKEEQGPTKLKYNNPDDTKKIDFDFPIKIDVMKEALKEIEIKKNMILFDDEMMIMSKNKILELVYKRLSGHIESYYKSKSGSWTSWRNKKGMEVDDAKYHRYFTGIDIIRLDVNERFNGHDFNNNIRIRKLINKVFYKNDFFCEKPPYLFDNLKVEGAGLKSWLFNRKEITQKKIGKNYYGEMADTNKALLKIVRKKFDSMKGKTNINWQNLIGEKEGETYIKKKYELEGRYKSGMMKSVTESIEDCKVDKVRGKVTYIFQKGLHETIANMQKNIKELKDRKTREIVDHVSSFYVERDNNWRMRNITSRGDNQSESFGHWWKSTSVRKDLYKRASKSISRTLSLDKGSDPTKSILGDKPVTYQNIFDLKDDDIQKIADYVGISGRDLTGIKIKKETWVNNILKKYKEKKKNK